jgi:hypothetical protein
MNALKHMEAIFVVTLSVAGIGSYLAATTPDAYAAAAPARMATVAEPDMPVVTVVAKRLTAAEKAESLRNEAATTRFASR